MKRIAVICVILEEPSLSQQQFNETVSSSKTIIRGRFGVPFEKEGIGVIALTVTGELDEINTLTGKLGNIPHVQVKTAISKKEVTL